CSVVRASVGAAGSVAADDVPGVTLVAGAKAGLRREWWRPPRGRTGPTATPRRGSSANRSSVRSISSAAPEPGRLTAGRPAGLDRRPQPHEMGLYKQYSGLVASGRKTTGIRGSDGTRTRR